MQANFPVSDEVWARRVQEALTHGTPSPLRLLALVMEAAASYAYSPTRLFDLIKLYAPLGSRPASPVGIALEQVLTNAMNAAIAQTKAFQVMREDFPALQAELLRLSDVEQNYDQIYNAFHDLHSDHEKVQREKNTAYAERAQVVASFFALWQRLGYVVGLATDDRGYEVAYADLPQGQVSWHTFMNAEHFAHLNLPPYAGTWDGHTTPQKYERLRCWVEETRLATVAPTVTAQVPHDHWEAAWDGDPYYEGKDA